MSRLTEEIRRLSRKLDSIEQRLEKVEESHNPKFTAPEAPQEPKFKKGDWVRSMVSGTIGQIESSYGFKNHLNDNWNVYLVTINGNHFTSRENLLEPYFPKEGEYTYVHSDRSGHNYIVIFSHKDSAYLYTKCSIDLSFNKFHNDGIPLIPLISLVSVETIVKLRPATAEEKKLLDSKLAEKRLKFDGKNIVKDNTPKVGDFCIFWDDDPKRASCNILAKIDYPGKNVNLNLTYPFTTKFENYKHCVKFESVEQFRRIKEGKK